jgi:hypothetical protein
MIKILAAYKLEKEHIHTQQQDPHPKKIARRMLAFISKLSLPMVIGSMLLFDLAFILLIMR